VNPLQAWIQANLDAFEMGLDFAQALIGGKSDEEVIEEFVRELEESDVQGITGEGER
jgi:hypothetical protein